MKRNNRTQVKHVAAAVALAFGALGAAQAAQIVIVNANGPGVGFNDPAPAQPVGGNAGTTLGEQRLIAFTYAANLWGAKLESTVPIRIEASFEPLNCTANSATLGSAGTQEIFDVFPNTPIPNTWFPGALANKLSGEDQSPTVPDIRARFNSRLGLAEDCLPGTPFYLGLDGNKGSGTDFVAVLLHEMGHGLGFQSFTDEETGQYFFGTPAVWDHFMTDNRTNRKWTELTPEERVANAISGDGMSWDGPNVNAAVPSVLGPRGVVTIAGPAAGAAAGEKPFGEASFGPRITDANLTGQIMPVVEDRAANTGFACEPLTGANAKAVKGNIALVDRGTCTFVVKAANVQAAGATAMIVADNAPGDPAGMSGSDPAVTIPAVRISQADGLALKAALAKRGRTASGVTVLLGSDPTQLAGTDKQKRILMFTPTTFQPGSSVSHYTTAASPNQLMEPSINGDLTHELEPPKDLSLPLLKDIGW
ncbi:peptidase [Pseudoduganella sp. SL102]|uniref:PA domain-containing protein n=1 Tax=Pseudoduganella sp. SL102 TaxID=2995154 RepID=UPI00248CF80C|nr:PA domain-containing protein [Pseudoduganella sp. SL102]WBS00340.1 peptidase [Pseudoduganella sp. SL102]